MSDKRKVLVIGLDCCAPHLIFEQWREDLPVLGQLREQGAYGELESCIPCITVPAWTAMMSSKDPGRLGFYGFRNRADYSYDKLAIATNAAVKEDRVWDLLSRQGRPVVVVGVPQTYPVRPVHGCLVASFLAPGIDSDYTYPLDLKQEIADVVGEYLIDVRNFRTEDKDWLLRQIYEMTEKRFKLVRHFLQTKPWDFFMFVEMGIDRIHHGFWKYMDPEHIKHPGPSPLQNAIKEYYQYVDREIGEVLDRIDEDTLVLVVSDHGAKRMDGGICVNEWLQREGYLRLKQTPSEVQRLEPERVDWPRTRAWGDGGYYGRIFMNVKGREPQGVIEPADYERVRDELKARLEALTDHRGRPIGTRVFKPQEIYSECRGVPPDLIVYFGDLYWRSVGTVGGGEVHVFENDTGPDDANHAQQGMFILYDPRQYLGGQKWEGLHLMDVAPLVLRALGMEVPPDMQGKPIGDSTADVYTAEEEKEIQQRLADLGYL
jgi:predicted AlkP superfamily phosphohydrolase/phosphomutase